VWNAPSGNSTNVIVPGISGGQFPSSVCRVVTPVLVCITCSVLLILWTSFTLYLLLDDLCHCFSSSLFEPWSLWGVGLPSLAPFCLIWDFWNMCCIVTQDNGSTRSSTPKSRYSSVWSLPAECICRASAKPRESSTQKWARDRRMSQYKHCFVCMSICVSWTNWPVKWANSLLMPYVFCFVLLNRYWGIVTVPGFPHERAKGEKVPTIENRGRTTSPWPPLDSLGWPDPHPPP